MRGAAHMSKAHGGIDVHLEPSGHAPGTADRVLDASDVPLSYWMLACLPAAGPAWRVFIGVNQTDIVPTWFLSSGDVLFVGVEQGVFALDASNGEPIASVTDASYVQSISSGPGGIVLVPAEDQLLAFRPDGTLMWRTNLPDVIEDLEDDREVVLVRDMSGHCYRLHPETGKPAA